MTVVQAAEVPVFPTFRGFRSTVVSEVDSAGQTASRSFGDRFRDGTVSAAKGIGVAVGATLAAGAGLAAVGVGAIFKKGLDRALNIQDATKQLEGLGHSAESVKTIMNNALASVKGTAFGLDSAATLAATVVAAGVKPGQELERTLKLTADAATIAKVPLGDMGQIIGKVASSGKLSTEVLNQFSQRGVPALQFVADQYGVTAAEASEMVSRGEVDFANFQAALERGVGGAALSSGETARGAFANIGAAFGRMGAMFAQPAVEGAPTLFQSIAGAVDRASAALAPYAAQFGSVLTPAIAAAAAYIDKIDFSVVAERVGSALGTIRDTVTGVIAAFQSGNFSGADSAFTSIRASLETLQPAFSEFGAQLPKIGEATAKLAGAGLAVLTDVLSFLADNVDTIIQFMPLIVAGFIAWRVAASATATASIALRTAELAAIPAQITRNGLRLVAAGLEYQMAAATRASAAAELQGTAAKTGGFVATIRNTAATVASRVAIIAAATAQRAAAAAQWLLNAAMSANPIGLVVAAVVALVAGLVFFFTQTELGQAIWGEFTRFLGEAWTNVVNGIQTAIQFLATVFSNAWSFIVSVVTTYITTVRTVIEAVVGFIVAAWNNYWAAMSLVISTVWNFIVGVVTGTVRTVMDIIIAVVTGISSFWSGIWSGIGTFFNTVWNGILGFVRGVVTTIASAISGFVTGVRTNVDNVIGFVRDIPGKVLGFLGNLGTLLVNSGRDLIQGFIDGIKGMLSNVGDAIGGVMDFVGGFFPNSPAKRGYFSRAGGGWAQVGNAGKALEDEFERGFSADGLRLQGSFDASLRAGTSTSQSVNPSGISPTDRPIYMDGTLFGWIRETTEGVARLIVNQANRDQAVALTNGASF